MLLHVPTAGGPTVLVSVPRDSYVSIPGRGKNKINAAYAFGGPSLLVQTLEQATGLRIDDYVETGLGGFANIVDAIGGVPICPKFDMNDKDAHINLKKGCQEADGTVALGYARARKSDPRGDLGRVERQREVLAAIASKTLSPGTLVQPWRRVPGREERRRGADDRQGHLAARRRPLRDGDAHGLRRWRHPDDGPDLEPEPQHARPAPRPVGPAEGAAAVRRAQDQRRVEDQAARRRAGQGGRGAQQVGLSRNRSWTRPRTFVAMI
jgi:LCP family protein required for cell wall assembly